MKKFDSREVWLAERIKAIIEDLQEVAEGWTITEDNETDTVYFRLYCLSEELEETLHMLDK